MFIIFSIVSVAVLVFLLSLFKGTKKNETPEHFLKNLGYSYELIDEKKIAIPKKFGENLQKYNMLQKKQVFDLSKYAVKVCVQQKYSIKTSEASKSNKKSGNNNNNNNNNYIADLIVFNGSVVGGSLQGELYGSEVEILKKAIV